MFSCVGAKSPYLKKGKNLSARSSKDQSEPLDCDKALHLNLPDAASGDNGKVHAVKITHLLIEVHDCRCHDIHHNHGGERLYYGLPEQRQTKGQATTREMVEVGHPADSRQKTFT